MKNIQLYQTCILSIILFVGVYFFRLDISSLEIWITFLTVIFLDYLFIKKWDFSITSHIPYSWINAAFWICFFLRSEDIILYVFAWMIAILSKKIIHIKWKHFLNPSNIGILITLFLFPQYTWINTLQWWNYSGIITSEYVVMMVLVICLWIYISVHVKRLLHYSYIWDYIIPFFLLHSILFFIIPYSEPISSYFLFFNISFFIFLFFMITDPKTIPQKSLSRFWYSFILVENFYILQFFINENYALLTSLFLWTLILPIIRELEIDKKYKYINSNIFLLLYNLLNIFVITLCLYLYWQPDLVFDNVCNQMFCK